MWINSLCKTIQIKAVSLHFSVVWFICLISLEKIVANLSSLLSSISILLSLIAFNSCRTWSSRGSSPRERVFFSHNTTAVLDCTVSLGCSRRLDHIVIKMELSPSFKQPNVRDKQSSNINAVKFIVIRSQTSLALVCGQNI